jgi:serine/threonine protein kinase
MEYIPGGSVAGLLSKSGPFPDRLCQSISFQLVNGLCYLHSGGVIHRDIKSANGSIYSLYNKPVLVDLDGLIKITDFGVSKKMDLEESAYDTRHASVRGTTNWMAPEMIVADQGYSAKIDIWSFGCLVVEMLTGKRPWQQFNSDAQVFRQLGKQNTPSLPTDISSAAASLLEKCFLYDINARPTALQLLGQPYLTDVDPLDTEFFDFNAFWTQTELVFKERIRKQLEELEDSDSSDYDE